MSYREQLYSRVAQALKNRPWPEKLADRFMSACMANDDLRVQLLRFIDVFPVLKTKRQIHNHFLSYVGAYRRHFPWFARPVLGLAYLPMAYYLSAKLIKRFVNLFAKRFIVSTVDTAEITKIGNELRGKGLDITWDLLGEEVLTQKEADDFKNHYLRLIEQLGATPLPEGPVLSGAEGFSHNISIKLSSLTPKVAFDPINWEDCANRTALLFAELLRAGMKHSVTINVDMEQYSVRDFTLEIFKRTLDRKEFDGLRAVGIVAQAYLADSEQSLDDLLNWIKIRKIPVTIRLVKGAYWDYEVISAQERGWPIPVLTDKNQTDRQFNLLAKKILTAAKTCSCVNFACASHNLNNLADVMGLLEELGLDRSGHEFQALYGMGDQIREAILDTGHNVRIYVPCGEPIAGMAYLVRRLLENTSQQSFLGTTFLRKGGE